MGTPLGAEEGGKEEAEKDEEEEGDEEASGDELEAWVPFPVIRSVLSCSFFF